MKNNKIYIIGSGAIGKALAVFLQHEEKDVTLVRGRVDNLPDEEFLITVTNQDHQKFQQKITTPTYSNLIDINGVVLIATKTWQ
ncbi:ketopantoate reductase family protein [Sunxiuqinia indica]|uniref:ketopantoate reductase family protein n=1 Tax=Sunxiuqinia indica TaxID=2692584 RepID=UPI001357A43B|nr:2-dehydropantoate 2-reductase N-terminal domain-containing protein [Sunxiuqinia indica]